MILPEINKGLPYIRVLDGLAQLLKNLCRVVRALSRVAEQQLEELFRTLNRHELFFFHDLRIPWPDRFELCYEN
jgi:hypothetical protein